MKYDRALKMGDIVSVKRESININGLLRLHLDEVFGLNGREEMLRAKFIYLGGTRFKLPNTDIKGFLSLSDVTLYGENLHQKVYDSISDIRSML